MVVPLPTVGVGLFPYAMVSTFMVVGSVWVLSRLFPRNGGPPDLATAILMVGVLVMTTGLWFAEIFAILDPGDASVVSVFIALNSMMGVVGAWAVGLFFRAEEKHLPSRGWGWPLSLAGLVVGNELLMGIAFVLAQVGPSGYSVAGWPGLAAVVADGVDSIWFFGAMFVTMEFLVLWLPLPSPQRRALVGFAATAAVSPWVVVAPLAGGLAMAGVMAVVSVLLAREVVRGGRVSVAYIEMAVGIAAAFGATGVSALAFLENGQGIWSPVPFALTSFFIMLLEVVLLGRWAVGRPAPAPPANPLAAARPQEGRPSSPPG